MLPASPLNHSPSCNPINHGSDNPKNHSSDIIAARLRAAISFRVVRQHGGHTLTTGRNGCPLPGLDGGSSFASELPRWLWFETARLSVSTRRQSLLTGSSSTTHES